MTENYNKNQMNRSGQKFFAIFLLDYAVQTFLELTETHNRSLLEVQQLHWLIGGVLSPKCNVTTLTDIRNIIATKNCLIANTDHK